MICPTKRTSRQVFDVLSNLTREFFKRLGCCPRFLTPAHPQACGLVERLVVSIKSAISKVAIDHPKHISLVFFGPSENL